MKNNQIIAAIDIGSSTVIGALAKISENGDIVPVAFAEAPSKGVKKGSVVHISHVKHTIDEVLDILQADGQYHIHSIVTSLSGISTVGYNAEGVVETKGYPITEHTILQAVSRARDTAALESRQLLHILKQHFILDRMSEVETPLGLMGEQLSIRVHVISVAKTAYYNLMQVFSHRDVDVDYVISSGFASAVAVSSKDEKELGVCVLDIGGGITEITVINNGVVKHTDVVPVGGDLISADIAFYMRTRFENAEIVKKNISICQVYNENELISNQELTDISREYSKIEIAEVMKLRCEQLIEITIQKLQRAGVETYFPGGFVICGGSANVKGFEELLIQKTQLPVRQAKVEIDLAQGSITGSRFATIMGLFICAYEEDYTRAMTDTKKIGIIKRICKPLTSIVNRLGSKF